MSQKNSVEDVFNTLFCSNESKAENAKNVQKKKCDVCSGKGGKIEENPLSCPMCNGIGTITTKEKNVFGVIEKTTSCDTCYGHGYQIIEPCAKCHGKGFFE